MPFDEEDDIEDAGKKTLKNVSSQKSIFDSKPKKQSADDFAKAAKQVHSKSMGYKQSAADLANQFNKLISSKTLKANRTIFENDIENELLSKMMQLAIDINSDPSESEGIGTLSWIALLLKISLYQRDKINNLEFQLSQLDKKIK